MNGIRVLDGSLRHYKYNSSFFIPKPRLLITIDYTGIVQFFQDLRYIGEMRQRWNEIKKFQVFNTSYLLLLDEKK
jgi:hypothetical protein